MTVLTAEMLQRSIEGIYDAPTPRPTHLLGSKRECPGCGAQVRFSFEWGALVDASMKSPLPDVHTCPDGRAWVVRP